MIPEQNLPEILEIPDGRDSLMRDSCIRVGYSMHGTIYRSENGKRFYRLIPDEQLPLRRRNAILEWIKAGTPACFAVAVTLYDGGDYPATEGYYILRYDSPSTARSLVDALRHASVYARLDTCIRTIKTFYTINAENRNFLPYPTDVILVDGQKIYFLGLIQWDSVDLATALSLNERSLYLAPEYVRGQGTNLQDAQTYALGCLLWISFYPPQNLAAIPNFLQHVANGSLFRTPYFENTVNTVPFWFRHISAYREMLDLAQGLLHPKQAERRKLMQSISPDQLSQKLHDYWQALHPKQAVENLRSKGESVAAMALLREILSTEQSFNLLLLASDIARNDLDQPLEAIDFLESAIALERQNEAPYLEQFRILIEQQMHIIFTQLLQQLNNTTQSTINLAPILRQYDDKVERNFQNFSSNTRKEELEHYAYYFIRQGLPQKAAKVVYDSLFDADKTFLWWEFRPNLLYMEILIYQKQLDAASTQLQSIKKGLDRVTDNRTMPMSEILEHGKRLAELEVLLLQARQAK